MMVTRRDLVTFGALIIAVGALGSVSLVRGFDLPLAVHQQLSASFAAVFTLTTAAGLAGILGLERAFPARPMQRPFSPSTLLDAFYLLVQLPVVAATVALITFPVTSSLQQHASGLALDPTGRLPWPVTLLVGLMVSDFVMWLTHVVKHKVPFIWRFHIVHHSQVDLNLFTANRTHPVDALLERFVGLVPAAILFPSIVASAQHLAWFGLMTAWFIRFQHANIRLNLGPLRYILVTPQSHRVHHSVHPDYWNTNFANVFCWDRLVGWQHPDDTSYPETGICDPAFPEPAGFTPTELVAAYLAQLRYPFDRQAVRVASGPPATRSESVRAGRR